MKKIVFMLSLCCLALVSCGGDDEPNNPDVINRPHDGKGQVFLEKGKLVPANLNYTQAELIDALNNYEWEQEYCFFYDNTRVGDKEKIGGLPHKTHTDGTIEYNSSLSDRIRTLTVKGKILYASMDNVDYTSSVLWPPVAYIVVALDMSKDGGRMVMDYKCKSEWGWEREGFDASSLYVRMVWKAVM